ncbi:MAG TPA: DUF167 domain-containing protein [Rhodanobacteraceae bacterium]|nr:DUF167 domain-containing protein [Rhodanobacteraceae bacterium]
MPMARLLTIKVKPNSRVSSLQQDTEGNWRAALRAPPVEGRANAELIALVAGHFGCAKAGVRITAGAGARIKRVRIED